MKAHAILLSLMLAPAANAQNSVLYEFDLRVTSNATLGTGLGGDLLLLPVGAEGTISILATDDPSLFQPIMPGIEQAYVIESISLSAGGVTAGSLSSVYPSTSLSTALRINNNFNPTATAIDSFSPGLFLDHPDIESTDFVFGQTGFLPNLPALIQSTELPLSLDLALANATRFDLFAAADTNLRVRFEFTDVTITVIPAPASIPLLALAALTTTRRRR